jgi:hypothetical protein
VSNKVKPSQEVIDWFETLGFKYAVVTDSVYRDNCDVPIHFFQTDSKNHTIDCSTIMADDAAKIYEASQ